MKISIKTLKIHLKTLLFQQDEKDENDAEGDLEMENLMGAFIVLVVGLVFSLFITAAEFMNEVRNIVIREKVKEIENCHKRHLVYEYNNVKNNLQIPSEFITTTMAHIERDVMREDESGFCKNLCELLKLLFLYSLLLGKMVTKNNRYNIK